MPSTGAFGDPAARVEGGEVTTLPIPLPQPDDQPRLFEFEGHQVRVVFIDGEPRWVANDVCVALGITDPYVALRRVDPDDQCQAPVIDSLGRKQQTNVVNESGLYELIFRSDKPEAKAFRHWVTSEVLPALRKNGKYGRELTRLEIAEMLVATEKERLALEAQLHEADERVDTLSTALVQIGPDAAAWRQLAASGEDWLVEEVAKILNRDPAIDIGPKRLWDALYAWDILTRYRDRATPRQKYIDKGYFRVRIVSYPDPRGGPTPKTSSQIRVTYEGITWLHRKLGGSNPVDELL